MHILKRVNSTYVDAKMEALSIRGALTVEHILPQQWIEFWPLPDGSKGMTLLELWAADPSDQRAHATRKRNTVLQTIGNLTVLTQPLNSGMSNSAWKEKKSTLLHHSLLPINQQLHDLEVWDEAAIEKRSDELFGRAVMLWPRG